MTDPVAKLQSTVARQKSEIARITQERVKDQEALKRMRALLADVLRDRPGAHRQAAEELAWCRNREWTE